MFVGFLNLFYHHFFHVQTQSPIYNQQFSGNGVAPTFVKVKQIRSIVILLSRREIKMIINLK